MSRLIIPQVRVADVPIYVSLQADGLKSIPFIKDKSVFKMWLADTPQILTQAMGKDFNYWKISKLLQKFPNEYKQVEEVIERHYATLKLMFVNLQCGDNYPFIGWSEFRSFCTQVKILDGTIEASDVDVQYVATKFASRSDKGLNRSEFLEILTRIAISKYKNTGKAKSFHAALNMLLTSIIGEFQFKTW